MRVVFLYLKTFDAIGGIEKFNKAFMKALGNIFEQLQICSVYDQQFDEDYVRPEHFVSYRGSKIRAIWKSLMNGPQSQVFILGHINLAIIGWLVKLINPKVKLVLIAHGVEVWAPQTGFKKKVLEKVDLILAVSQYTKKLMSASNNISLEKIQVFPNTIDPFLPVPTGFRKDQSTLDTYHLAEKTPILLTVSRLSATEGYKGYDRVLEALPKVKAAHPDLKYFIVGKGDPEEVKRIEGIIEELSLQQQVILTGYVSDEQLDRLYRTADIFVMPSKGEGFGIVFIEAMAYGMKVIAGNADGSVDALHGGELGLLVNPEKVKEITSALLKSLGSSMDIAQKQQQQDRVYELFGFEAFQGRLQHIIK